MSALAFFSIHFKDLNNILMLHEDFLSAIVANGLAWLINSIMIYVCESMFKTFPSDRMVLSASEQWMRK